MKRSNKILIFCIILILAILLRLSFLDLPFATDTNEMALGIKEYSENKRPQTLNWYIPPFQINSHNYTRFETDNATINFYFHPPISIWFYGNMLKLFTNWIVGIRLLIILLSIISIILIFLLTKELYGLNTAFVAMIISSISIHGIFHQAFRLTKESIIIVLLLLAYFLYTKHLKEQKTFYIICIGILGGLIILTRTVAIVFIITFILYELYNKRYFNVFILIFIPTLMFNTWIVYDTYDTGLEWYHTTKEHSSGVPTLGWTAKDGRSAMHAFTSDIVQTGLLLIEITPALFMLFLISVFESFKYYKKNKNLHIEIMMLLWISLWYFGFALTTGQTRFEKYFYMCIPFMYIIVSKLYIKYKPNYKVIINSFGIYLILLMMVKYSDTFLYTFIFNKNFWGLLVWILPFIISLYYFINKKRCMNILTGFFIAACIYALIFPTSIWIISNSIAVKEINKLPENIEIITKNGDILTGAIFHDWLEDGKVDRIYTINGLKEFKNINGCRQGLTMPDNYIIYIYCE